MKVVAMVPIKLNSERVKEKNLRPFYDGKPLVQFILEALKGCKHIDEIYVYCSNERIKDYLIDGVKYLKRPDFLDLNTSNCNDIIREFMKEVNADYHVVSHATAPFTRSESIDACIEKVMGDNEFDSAFTVDKKQTFMWENGKPMNFDVDHFPRTQDLSPIYMETSGAFIFPRWVFEKFNRRVGVKPALVEVEPIESLDIDTEYDMMVAQALYKYMNENK
ncbi:MAG TPA: acylneuraminate cytidylyltransferase family protein [Paludibacteraceae bacterium]|nr:acylneuraminate cytidylyltransferase family protein [Paludibacteraceae bacterium]